MQYRQLGRTDMKVSAISFGAWAIGGTWGPVDDAQSLKALHAARRRGHELRGHGRRLRRRAQRAARRAAAARAARREDLRGDEGRPSAAGADARGLQPREPERLGRPQPEEPRDGRGRPAAAALPAPAGLRPAGGLRHPRRPGRGREDPLLRHQRRDGRRGAAGHRAPERADRADHLQHAAAQAGRGVLRPRAGAPRRHPRARAARERPAHRQAHAPVGVRGGRPPRVQPQRRGLRQGRDLLGRAVRARARGRRARCGRSCPRAPRWRSWRCAGS